VINGKCNFCFECFGNIIGKDISDGTLLSNFGINNIRLSALVAALNEIFLKICDDGNTNLCTLLICIKS
jgi:hypothetical protein